MTDEGYPNGSFEWRGLKLPLWDHPYNDTINNERAVEIPIALDFLARGHGRVLEVGNVLAHYFTEDQLPPRVIVDAHEIAAGVTNVDVFHAEHAGPEFDTIVSISTIEHVRWDEPGLYRNPAAAIAALYYLRGLLASGGRMLVTAEMHHSFQNAFFGEAHHPMFEYFLTRLGYGDDYDDPMETLGENLDIKVLSRVDSRWAWYHEPVEGSSPSPDRAVWIGEWNAP